MTIQPLTTESSRISGAAYDPATNVLRLQFWTGKGDDRHPGPVYDYRNFPPEKWAEFMAAESKGSWFGKNIAKSADLYPYTKIEQPTDKESK